MYNLVFFFLAGLVSAIFTSTGSRHSMAADDSRGTEQRLINASELDQLLTVLTRDPPQSFEIEVFSVVDRPKKNPRRTGEKCQADGRRTAGCWPILVRAGEETLDRDERPGQS